MQDSCPQCINGHNRDPPKTDGDWTSITPQSATSYYYITSLATGKTFPHILEFLRNYIHFFKIYFFFGGGGIGRLGVLTFGKCNSIIRT